MGQARHPPRVDGGSRLTWMPVVGEHEARPTAHPETPIWGYTMRNLQKPALSALGAVVAAVLTASASQAQDAAVTDPDLYHVIFENDRVRVLEYQDEPGDKTSMHDHPAFLVYALSAFERRLTLPDGTELNRSFTPGQVLFSEAQTHAGENIGTTPTHIIMVELK